jgi:hypothetical protein
VSSLAPLSATLAAAGMRSDYQLLKRQILEVLPLSKDAIHIYIGVGCLLLSVFVLRQHPAAWSSLLLGVVVSLGMEALDLRDNIRYPLTVRIVETARDLLNTNLSAFLFVLATRLRLGKPTKPGKPTRPPPKKKH